MPLLNSNEYEILGQQRFGAPILDALRRAASALGAEESSASLDKPSVEAADYQTKMAFSIAKTLRCPPLEAAAKLADRLNVELAGNGTAHQSPNADGSLSAFVNIKLSDSFILAGARARNYPDAPWLATIVDYSSPNCAKRMHVGHLRSSVIGDALCRLMEHCGASVERVNHLGDWGTPFGVIIEQAKEELQNLAELSLEDIEGIYQRGSARMSIAASKAPEQNQSQQAWEQSVAQAQAFAQKARATTAQMQSREQPAFGAWQTIRARTLSELQATYGLLGIGLRPEHAIGESAYQDAAGPLIERLVSEGLCQTGPQGTAYLGGKTPLALSKSASAGGGLLYGGTDVAALARRGATGSKILYVTDDRQADHFANLIHLGEKAGLIQRGQAIHVPFGMMLSADGTPFKSRTGGALPLADLVESAIQASIAATLKKSPETTLEDARTLAGPLGIGALKYDDLSRNRTSSVKFDMAHAVSLDGDTAPYLIYARVRALSAATAALSLPSGARATQELDPFERKLALAIAKIRDGACDALALLEPHRLCLSLQEAASAFSSFYLHCHCIDKTGCHDPIRTELMSIFAESIGQGLDCLGIQKLESMPKNTLRPPKA